MAKAISFTVIRISLSSVLYNFVLFSLFSLFSLFLIIDLECLVSTHGKRCSYIFVSSSPGLCSQPAGIVCENRSKERCSRTQVGFVSVESSEQYPVTKHIVNKRFFLVRGDKRRQALVMRKERRAKKMLPLPSRMTRA